MSGAGIIKGMALGYISEKNNIYNQKYNQKTDLNVDRE